MVRFFAVAVFEPPYTKPSEYVLKPMMFLPFYLLQKMISFVLSARQGETNENAEQFEFENENSA
jgi:hypothetical protein